LTKLIWYGRAPSGAEVEVVLEDMAPEQVVPRLGALDAALKAASFGPSDRFARPTYGGGGGPGKGKRPDLAPPPGIIVPEHCGEPMKYIVYAKDSAKGHEGRGVPPGKADMWVCHKDKLCEEVTSGRSERAFATFDMKPIPAAQDAAPPAKPPAPPAAAAAAPPPPAPASPPAPDDGVVAARGTGPPPGEKAAGDAAWASFDAKAEALGYSEATLAEIARGIVIQKGVTTRGQLAELIERMVKAPRRRG
jgi:hypothetical protein